MNVWRDLGLNDRGRKFDVFERFVLLHTYKTCSELPSYVCTMVPTPDCFSNYMLKNYWWTDGTVHQFWTHTNEPYQPRMEGKNRKPFSIWSSPVGDIVVYTLYRRHNVPILSQRALNRGIIRGLGQRGVSPDLNRPHLKKKVILSPPQKKIKNKLHYTYLIFFLPKIHIQETE